MAIRMYVPLIRVKYLRDVTPFEQTWNSDWIDLRCAEDIPMKKGEYRCIPLGVAMQLPEGYEALIIPRSSTFKTWKIIQTNHCGLIDNSYCGDNDEWMFPAYAMEDTFIEKNSRICQFRIQKSMGTVCLLKADHLGNENRGGFGSSGTK